MQILNQNLFLRSRTPRKKKNDIKCSNHFQFSAKAGPILYAMDELPAPQLSLLFRAFLISAEGLQVMPEYDVKFVKQGFRFVGFSQNIIVHVQFGI